VKKYELGDERIGIMGPDHRNWGTNSTVWN